MIRKTIVILVVFSAIAFSLTGSNTSAQKPGSVEIGTWRDVLKNVKAELKRSYYDPNFHGMDIEARFKAADEKMKSAESLAQLVGIVAQVLLELNDSHTAFIPPRNASQIEYGFRMQPVGDHCYVRAVRPGSDAAIKGLEVGDKVISIDGRPLDRNKVWLAEYLYYTLRPQSTMRLIIQKPDKPEQPLNIEARVREGTTIMAAHELIGMDLDREEEERLGRHRFHEPSDDLLIWKMPLFDLDQDGLASKFGKLKNRKALILDLRGNSGGYVDTLERFAGYFFDSNIKLADRRGRKEMDPMVAKSQKEKAFKGQLIVLIDGSSASAAEVFARVVQLEKRGVVIGDRSSGMVMQSRYHPLQVGVQRGLGFGIDATEADVIMTDGKSLEHVGVTPDQWFVPTPQAMRANMDPVLSHAASLAGVQLDPQKAGSLFPFEWKTR